jgi:DNA (cytosine-5)-methyltransferase 1|nr:MAG TPA: Cytosine specific methyltransferase [Caudoviricetes sp.]
MDKLTLGSLFDGSGGFPLAGRMIGIEPMWASEIEPFPIRVTTKRIPQMKHYGDITQIDGSKIEPVDIITFGSPCQDLSLAGKRNGLDGEKSSLFFEAVRIIKEMRKATYGKYPRWIVWENVPGALSSNKGQDFRTVLNEICKIKDETVSVPMPEKKWETAGEIMGEDLSIAYRILNAQFFGIAQRRRRIFLVADFGGNTGGKVLFESEGMFRDLTQKRGSWQGITADIKKSIGVPGGIVLNDQGGQRIDITKNYINTLRAQAHHPPCIMETAGFCTEHSAKSRSIGYEVETAPTLRQGKVPAAVALENHPNDSRVKIDASGTIQTLTGRAGTGGGNVPMVMNEREQAATVLEDVANPLMATDYKGTQCVFEEHKPKTMKIRSGCEGGGKGVLIQDNKSAILGCNNDQTVFVTDKVTESYAIQGSMIGRTDENGPNGSGINSNICFTLNTVDKHAVYTSYQDTIGALCRCDAKEISNQYINQDKCIVDVLEPRYTVRRLTPLECCRLQGFPDYWCDDLGIENPTDTEIREWGEIFETHRKALDQSKKPKSRNQIVKWLKNPHSDSVMYAMWGNGVALPCVFYVLNGIANL